MDVTYSLKADYSFPRLEKQSLLYRNNFGWLNAEELHSLPHDTDCFQQWVTWFRLFSWFEMFFPLAK